MKALFPVFCRPLGYVVLLVALFLLPILLMQGLITDHNLLFYKECTKLLMMAGCLLIIFALSKNESRETEQIRNAAVRNAVFLTFLFVFGGMLWRVLQGDVINVDTSSFFTFFSCSSILSKNACVIVYRFPDTFTKTSLFAAIRFNS